jgi:pimeloyl-ACP methyl ester carboxylesterase
MRGSETAPGMAQAGRSGLLRERILDDRVSRRVELGSRRQDIFWQETPFLIGRKLLQPKLYVGGADDAVVEFARPYVDNLEKSVPNLWNKVLPPLVGHWTEQEAPTEVNRLMVDFLGSMDGAAGAK